MTDTVLDRSPVGPRPALGPGPTVQPRLVPVVDPDGPVASRLLGAVRHPDHPVLCIGAVASVFLGPVVFVTALVVGGWLAVTAMLVAVGSALLLARASAGVIYLDLVAPNLRPDDVAALAEMQDLRNRLTDASSAADRHVVADVDRLVWAAARQARRGVATNQVTAHLATIRKVASISTRATAQPSEAAIWRLEHYVERQHALIEAHHELA